jgi:hypothetical protein
VYVDGEFHEKNTNFAFYPGSVDVACDQCDSGTAHKSSDFLFKQEQLGDAVLGRPSKSLL